MKGRKEAEGRSHFGSSLLGRGREPCDVETWSGECGVLSLTYLGVMGGKMGSGGVRSAFLGLFRLISRKTDVLRIYVWCLVKIWFIWYVWHGVARTCKEHGVARSCTELHGVARTFHVSGKNMQVSVINLVYFLTL